jgi:hypothetical protein
MARTRLADWEKGRVSIDGVIASRCAEASAIGRLPYVRRTPATQLALLLGGRMPPVFPWAGVFSLSFGCFGFFFSFLLSLFPIVALTRFLRGCKGT